MKFSHKHIHTLLLILLFILQGSTIALADRLYMAPNGSNDTGDGSRGNPYLTLGWIVRNVLTPNTGDTVMVMSGTHDYDPQVIGLNCRVRGHPDAFLTIMADPLGETRPVISPGGATATCWHFTTYYQVPRDDPDDSVAYLRIQGIEFSNGGTHLINFDDGAGGSRGIPAHHIIFEDCVFDDPGLDNHHLKMAGIDTFLIKDCEFKNNRQPMIDMVGCHWGTITNCTFVNTSTTWSMGNGVTAKGGSAHITIDRCYFSGNGYGAIRIGQHTGEEYWRPIWMTLDGDGEVCDYESKDINVYRSIFVDISQPIKFAGSRGGGVYNCTFYSPAFYDSEPTGVSYMFNIYSSHTEMSGDTLVWPRDGEIINNIVVHNGSWGEAVASTNTVVFTQSSTTNPTTFLYSHNLWNNLYNPGTIPDWDYLAALFGGIGSPQHDNDFTGDPLFVGGANPELPEHFQLTEGSPAATAGIESSYQIYDYFNGMYLQDLDYNNRVWSSPRSLGAFGMTVSGAPLSGPDVHKLQPGDLLPIFND